MFPLSVINYVKIGAIILLLFGFFAFGWNSRNNDYMAYKRIVQSEEKAQEAKVESITKQQSLVTKGISNEYDAKIIALRQYYKSTSVYDSSTSKVPGLSTTPKSADVISSYNQLAESCAETTQQLVSLQSWINEQIGIK